MELQAFGSLSRWLVLVAGIGLSACGGGGGSAGGAVRQPLATLAEEIAPVGARVDVAARDFFPMTPGDALVYQAQDAFSRFLDVERRVEAADAQGRILVRESIPADPLAAARTERWQRGPQGIVAVDYQSERALGGPRVPIGDFLLYPIPFYPEGSVRTAVRQGSLQADTDGDGIDDSFRFEFSQQFVGFETGVRAQREEVRARFVNRVTIVIQPSRVDMPIRTLSDLTEETVFAAHTGLIGALRQDRMALANTLPYRGVALMSGTVGGRDATTAWNAGTARFIRLQHTAVVFEPVHGHYYAGVPASAPDHPGSIVRIDPATGALTFSPPLGADPRSIAAAGDGSTLYVGLRAAAEVIELSLPDLQIRRRIAIEPGTSAYSVAASPVDPATFAYAAEGSATSGLVLVRAGVLQPRTTFRDITPAASHGALAFDGDGTHLIMIGGDPAGRALFQFAVDGDGVANAAIKQATDFAYGNSITPVGADLLVGSALFRSADLAFIAHALPDDAESCRPLRNSTRWVCGGTVLIQPAVTVVDSLDMRLIEDGHVRIPAPWPDGFGSTSAPPMPGPVGQVAVSVGGLTGNVSSWLVLFDNPDFR